MTSKLCPADSPDNVRHAANLLRKGGVIIHPTETLYGFAANALDIKSIRRVDTIKERRSQDTYLVLMKDRAMALAHQMAFDRVAAKLADRFWPGPLTLVLPVSRDSSLIHLASHGMLAARVSPDPFVQALFKLIDFPIISTSVNKSGMLPLNEPQAMEAQFKGEVDLILERGTNRNTRPSTIVSCVNNVLSVIREGAVSEEELYGG